MYDNIILCYEWSKNLVSSEFAARYRQVIGTAPRTKLISLHYSNYVPILSLLLIIRGLLFKKNNLWKRFKVELTISIRSSSGSPYFVRNNVFLNSSKSKTIKQTICGLWSSKSSFYKEYSYSKYTHLQLHIELGCKPSDQITPITPRSRKWTFNI